MARQGISEIFIPENSQDGIFFHVVGHTVGAIPILLPPPRVGAGDGSNISRRAKFLQEKVYRKMTSEVSARTVIQQTGTREWRLRAGIQLLLEYA